MDYLLGKMFGKAMMALAKAHRVLISRPISFATVPLYLMSFPIFHLHCLCFRIAYDANNRVLEKGVRSSVG